MTVRETIQNLIENKRRFAVMANFYTFLDMLTCDASDEDNFRFICKFNTNAKSILEPTFGSTITTTGLQEVIIPYNQIVAINVLDVSDDLLEKLKTENPEAYKYYSEANEVVGYDFNKGVSEGLTKSKAVQEYEKAHKDEIAAKNRTSAIKVEEVGVKF